MKSLTLKTLLLAPLLAVLAACDPATFNPNYQETRTFVQALPEQIRCNLTGANGKTMSLTTPAYAPAEQFGNWYRIKCFAGGYWDNELVVRRNTRATLVQRALRKENIDPRVGDYYPVTQTLLPFPTELTFVLRRNSFDTEQERDIYYAEHKARVDGTWAEIIGRVERACQNTGTAVSRSPECRDALLLITQERRNALDTLEVERRRSRVP